MPVIPWGDGRESSGLAGLLDRGQGVLGKGVYPGSCGSVCCHVLQAPVR